MKVVNFNCVYEACFKHKLNLKKIQLRNKGEDLYLEYSPKPGVLPSNILRKRKMIKKMIFIGCPQIINVFFSMSTNPKDVRERSVSK